MPSTINQVSGLPGCGSVGKVLAKLACRPGISALHCMGLATVVNTYNPSTQEVVAAGLEVQGHFHRYRELEMSLGCKIP